MTLKDSVLLWLSTGQIGSSSKAMAFCAIGINHVSTDHPRDPADLNRCLLLVAQIPAIKKQFPDIAKLSPQWHALIDNWYELCTMFVDEVGWDWAAGGQATNTYRRMKELFLDATEAEK